MDNAEIVLGFWVLTGLSMEISREIMGKGNGGGMKN
jgi:hypothetical protein